MKTLGKVFTSLFFFLLNMSYVLQSFIHLRHVRPFLDCLYYRALAGVGGWRGQGRGGQSEKERERKYKYTELLGNREHPKVTHSLFPVFI